MIITRTPFRLSFVGGGSDLPSYYMNEMGSVISIAINRFMYVSVNTSFSKSIRLAYNRVEQCKKLLDVKHPLVRESANLIRFDDYVEITSTADIPSEGSGLGSSSSFTVGLLNALTNYQKKPRSKYELAELACKVEIEYCNQPIGKQDQFAASFGGCNLFKFHSDGSVEPVKVDIPPFAETRFLNSLLVFYTGTPRNASSVLDSQDKATKLGLNTSVLKEMVGLVPEFREHFCKGNVEEYGQILHTNWMLKKTLSNNISNNVIDEIYQEGIRGGALGGKLLGAGNGGFIIFIAPPESHNSIKKRLSKLKQETWSIDKLGTTVIYG